MELIWLVVGLLVLDLAAVLFATDSRPGFERSARPLGARAHGSRAVRARARRVAGG